MSRAGERDARSRGIDRRRFLGFTLGAAAGAALGTAGGRLIAGVLASADATLYPPRGPEEFVLSVCAMCPGGCGVRARRIGERVVKLEGNTLHPVNGGRLCPKGQAALQALYHPDRARGPLRRVGPRGALASFEPVPWDRALDEIGGRLRALREGRRPEALALVRGRSGGIAARVTRRFLEAFGSPNDVLLDRGDEAAAIALLLSQGVRAAPAFDLAAADYVLSLGSALLEASGSPVHAARAYGEFRQGRTGHRGKLVHVGPRLSISGACADEWIAVRPGTEGVFALGVAAVIVGEGLFKRDFVADRTAGFEEGAEGALSREGRTRRGLRSLLEEEYGLERVAGETGVSVNVVLRIAREFAAARAAVAVGPRGGPLLPGRPFDHLAAYALNALVGNIDAPGGLLVAEEVPLAAWPPLADDEIAATGRARPRADAARAAADAGVGGAAGGGSGVPPAPDPERLAEAMLSGEPYPIAALLVLGADPVLSSAAPDRFAAAMEHVPLVVSFASIPDDTALRADWILPETHFLEQWDLHTTPPGVAYPLASLARPALAAPLHDARPAAEVLIDLARRVGPEVAAAFPARELPALLRAEMDGLFAARRGAVMGSAFDEAWVRMMEDAGWWAPGYHSADELWEKAQSCGGWWDPFYDHGDWRRVLKTGSGRCELLADKLHAPPARSHGAAAASEERDAIPREPLALLLFEPLPVAGGGGAELPFLQGILDPGHEERWATWAEIHPETAGALGVKDRQRVRVASFHGAVVVRARVTPRVVPGAVAIPVGLGKGAGGRWARGIGANPLRLLAPERDAESGLAEFQGTPVSVAVAGGSEAARAPGEGA